MCNTINVVLQFLHNMSVKIVRSSLQEIASAGVIIEKLEPHIRDISYRTYFRKR